MGSSHSASLKCMSEGAFDDFASPPHQSPATTAILASPVGVDCVAFFRLSFPSLALALWLCNIAAPTRQLQCQHDRLAVVPLVGHCFFWFVRALRLLACMFFGIVEILLGSSQRSFQRRGVALVSALQRDRHHRTRVHVDRMLLFVGQM